jgi:hypothetical protein
MLVNNTNFKNIKEMNEKIKLSVLSQDELDKFIKSNDVYPVPDGYEVYKTPTRAEKLATRLKEVEAELAGMKEPTTEELIAEGRMMHPYYMLTEELGWLKKELGVKEPIKLK